MIHNVDYKGPPRKPEDVIAAALADEDLRRQAESALDEMRRGIPGVLFRQVVEEQRWRRSA